MYNVIHIICFYSSEREVLSMNVKVIIGASVKSFKQVFWRGSEIFAGVVTVRRAIGLAILLLILGISESRINSLRDESCNVQMRLQDYRKMEGIPPTETFQQCLDRLKHR